MIAFIVIVGIAAIITGTVIGSRKGQPVLAFILCLFLSWLGVLIVALSANTLKKRCPHCLEFVMKDAAICPHCRHTLVEERKEETEEEAAPGQTHVIFKEGVYFRDDDAWTPDPEDAWRVNPKSEMIQRITTQLGGRLIAIAAIRSANKG